MQSKRSVLFLFFIVVFVLIVLSAFVINSVLNTEVQDTEASDGVAVSPFKEFIWNFDSRRHGEQISRLSAPNGITLDVKFEPNSEDYPNNYTNISGVKVADPAAAIHLNDLGLSGDKSLILADTSSEVTESLMGGKFIFEVRTGNLVKVDFDLKDVGDESSSNGRINNQYFEIIHADNTSSRDIDINTEGNIDHPNGHITNVFSPYYDRDPMKYIKSFVVHISGTGSLDNLKLYALERASTPVPTIVPTSNPTPTIRPTTIVSPTPTSIAQDCVDTKRVRLFNRDLLVANANNSRTGLTEPDPKGNLPSGVKLVNSTTHKIDLADTSIFKDDEDNLRYKYPIQIMPMWGWRGKNNQITEATEQKNESHTLTAVKKIKSNPTTENIFSMDCIDWGNVANRTDGKRNLRSVEHTSLISNSRFFQKCVTRLNQANNPVVTKGVEVTLAENEVMEITATHKTTEAEFNECLRRNNNRAPRCQGSHYSMIEVTYCVEEGELE